MPLGTLQFSTLVEGRYLIFSSWLVRRQNSRRTALRIFPIFGMNVPHYKTKKRTRPFFRENSGSCTMCINSAHMHIGLFLDFGGSDRLDIAYDGSPKCFSTYGAGYSSCINPVYAQCA